jgi:hypothetical protein
MADTGHGASVTFGTTGGTWLVREINSPGQFTRPRVQTTYLGTSAASGQTYMPGDLDDHEEVELTIVYQTTQGLPARGTANETITVTFPISAGGSSASTVAGNGFITGADYPPLQTNTLQEGKIRFSWANLPTFTAQT